MDNGEGEIQKIEYSPKVGFGENGIVVKNRAYRRAWKNRAMMEGRKTKHYYTKSQKRKKRK